MNSNRKLTFHIFFNLLKCVDRGDGVYTYHTDLTIYTIIFILCSEKYIWLSNYKNEKNHQQTLNPDALKN